MDSQTIFEQVPEVPDDMFVVNPDGLVINQDPTFEQWQAFGRRLFEMGNAVQWATGDWLVYGEAKGDWGETYA